MSGDDQKAATLSGGNQQKVVFARWLATAPRLFLLDEPTRGLDVGAKTEILKLILELAAAHTAVLLISSEIEELTRVCDRYLIMSHGRITGELPATAAKPGSPRGGFRSCGNGGGAVMTPIATTELGRFALRHGFVLVILAVYLCFSIAAPSFFGFGNLVDIFHITAPMMVVASGMALIVISGKLDISVGSIAYVASAIFALLMRHTQLPVVAGWGMALVAGLLLGAINASIIVFLRVNSLIATLGTMIAFRGFGLSLTNGGLIEMPDAIKPLGNIMVGPVFLDTLIALAIVVAVHFVHQWTNFGRQLTAIGNGEEVARRIGIPVDRRVFVSFVLSGFLASVAGVIYTMQVAVNTSKIGEGMEFTAIAVVVVGGISLFGGRGNILTAVILGSLTFQMIRSGLQHIGANPYSYRLVEGVVIFVAMYVDALKSERVGSWRSRRQEDPDWLERLTSRQAPKLGTN